MKQHLLSMMMLMGWASSASATLVGHWEFEDSNDLGKATVGNDLTLNNSSSSIVAATGLVAGDGAAEVGVGDSFSLAHDIGPNGTSSEWVDEYTIVYDINTKTNGVWRSLLQTTTTPGGNDGDYFISSSNTIGVGAINYTSSTVAADTWYRIVFAVDLGSTNYGGGSFQTTVIDTSDSVVFQYDHAFQDSGGRHSLHSTANSNIVHFFADDNSEDNLISVTQLALFDHPFSSAEALSLGGPGTAVPEPSTFGLFALALLTLGVVQRRR